MKYILALTTFLFPVIFLDAQKKSNEAPVNYSQENEHNNLCTDRYQPIDNVKWKFKTGGKVFSSPAVLSGIAIIGSEDKNLYAVDINTGKQKWKFTTGGATHSSPVISNGTIYFGSFDGYYYAIDFLTGKEKWKFKTGGEKHFGDTSYWGMKPAGIYMDDPWDLFLSSPVVNENTGTPVVYFGSSDGNLYAVNVKNGIEMWKFKTNGNFHSSPVLKNDILYIGNWDTYFYAINSKTGKELWKFKTGEQVAMAGIQSSATVSNGMVYFGARDGYLYALDACSGNVMWKYDASGSWIVSTAVVKDGVLYVGTSDTYLLLALDAKTGKEKFRFKTNGYVFGKPAIIGNTVYFGDFTGKMYSLDITSAGKIWNSFSTEKRSQNAGIILKNDTLDFAFAAKGGDLSFYDVNKEVMDDFYTLGPIVSSPLVQGGVLFFGSADGYLYALKLKKE